MPDPNDVVAMLNRAIAMHQTGNLAEAESLYRRVLTRQKNQPDALHFLGIIAAQGGRHEEALKLIAASLKFNSSRPEPFANHARVLNHLDRYHEALASADKALRIKPGFPDALISRGNALYGLARHQDALASYDSALKLNPHYAEALVGRGNALLSLFRLTEALSAFDKAVALRPDIAEGWSGRGLACFWLGRYDEAVVAYDRALAIKADLKYVAGNRAYTRMFLSDWSRFSDDCDRLAAGIGNGDPVTVPFSILPLPLPPELQKKCAQIYVTRDYPASPSPMCRGARYSHDRVRVAYLSGDYWEHPVARATAGLFEHHDRSRFEIFGVSFGPDDDSKIRKRLISAFERFVDVRNAEGRQIAELIRGFEIDILVDLMGFTRDARTNVLAFRPAPIQVNYLGYPGTMGAEYIDYIIADEIVVPSDQQQHYTEKVVCLPDSFLVNDAKRQISGSIPSRADCGLPEQAFVFCAFNANYKITPEIFDVWMRILRAVDGSVLWLLQPNEIAKRNLLREALSRGVAPDRLVFAPRISPEDHLSRQPLADLFLDTLPFNAHTTASDALWSGLPVLTCLGATFAGRVAGSLLHAVGLPELVANSLAEYEAVALKLAREPALLASLKMRLVRHRATHPLFDTGRFARHIESAYKTMIDCHSHGEKCAAFVVEPDA
jgi:predicted O-linked N-acetylglucosamine transferase (SPINDLY family)